MGMAGTEPRPCAGCGAPVAGISIEGKDGSYCWDCAGLCLHYRHGDLRLTDIRPAAEPSR